MTKHLAAILVLTATALPVTLSAAVPLRWTVETSRVQPAQFEAYHGETIEFEATVNTYGKPLAITNDLIGIYWQTNGMGSAYWTAPAVISNNVMIARFEPSMDVGASVYSCFIGCPGEIYRAAFQLRLRPSPGAVPSELPLPVKTLDFAQVTVLNAPYYTRGETDALTDNTIASHNTANDAHSAKFEERIPYANAAKTAVTIGGLNTAQSTDGGGTVAIGHNTRALADSSFAGGHRAMTATGTKYALSFGNRSFASTGAIALGYQAWASSTGNFVDDDSDVVVGLGQKHKYSFVWQGKDDSNPGYYHSHGDGTFNINPIGGLGGVWIGSQTLASLLNAKQPTISDLATIRSGAELGATAVQPSAISDMETQTHAAATYQPKGSYLTSESDPTVSIAISTHNSSSSAHSDIRTAVANAQAHSEATRQIVSTWEGFLDGSNVVFSITNYISGTYSLDHAKLQIKELLPDANEYRIVYDSRIEITNHTAAAKREIVGYVDGVATELRGEIAEKGDKAWGRRSSTGQDVPISNTVWVTEQNLRIAGGMEYERVAVGEGAIYVLTSKGQTPYMIGDEGALMLKDDGGTNYFGMVRSDSYTVGCNTDGIRTQNNLVYLDYAVTMSDHPCIWYTESLEGDVVWEQLNLPDGSAVPGASHTVIWDESPRLGAQECYINCPEGSGFFRATIEVAGDARFRTNMPAEIPSFYCADNPDKKVKIIWNNGNPKFVEAN